MYMCLSAHRVGAGREGRGGGLGWVGVGVGADNTSLSKEEKKKVLTKINFKGQVQWYEIEQLISFSPM